MAGVDHRHAGPQARQLVGQGDADQPGTDHRHVAAPFAHAPESIRPATLVPAVGHMSTVEAVRTPEDRFADLPGYPFSPRYVTLPDGLRMHYVDEGPADAEVVLLLHGQPTWSYLYRTVVARLTQHGLHAVAPDLIGFGRSDKPVARDGVLGPGPRRLAGQFIGLVGLVRPDPRRPGLGRPHRPGLSPVPTPGSSAGSSPPTPCCTRPIPRWRDGWNGPATPARTAP